MVRQVSSNIDSCASAHPLLTRMTESASKSLVFNVLITVKKYDKYMGEVDLLDALISYCRIRLKSNKCYHCLFFIFGGYSCCYRLAFVPTGL